MTKIERAKPSLVREIKDEPTIQTLMTDYNTNNDNATLDPQSNSTKRKLSELDMCSQQSDNKKLKLGNHKSSLTLSQVNLTEIEEKYLTKHSSGKVLWWNLFRKCVIYLDRFLVVG
jgi:hypothetical protein